MRFRQLAQHVFDTRPFAEQSAEGVGVMLRRVRVLQTDHLVADGANDPLCFEIRNRSSSTAHGMRRTGCT